MSKEMKTISSSIPILGPIIGAITELSHVKDNKPSSITICESKGKPPRSRGNSDKKTSNPGGNKGRSIERSLTSNRTSPPTRGQGGRGAKGSVNSFKETQTGFPQYTYRMDNAVTFGRAAVSDLGTHVPSVRLSVRCRARFDPCVDVSTLASSSTSTCGSLSDSKDSKSTPISSAPDISYVSAQYWNTSTPGGTNSTISSWKCGIPICPQLLTVGGGLMENTSRHFSKYIVRHCALDYVDEEGADVLGSVSMSWTAGASDFPLSNPASMFDVSQGNDCRVASLDQTGVVRLLDFYDNGMKTYDSLAAASTSNSSFVAYPGFAIFNYHNTAELKPSYATVGKVFHGAWYTSMTCDFYCQREDTNNFMIVTAEDRLLFDEYMINVFRENQKRIKEGFSEMKDKKLLKEKEKEELVQTDWIPLPLIRSKTVIGSKK